MNLGYYIVSVLLPQPPAGAFPQSQSDAFRCMQVNLHSLLPFSANPRARMSIFGKTANRAWREGRVDMDVLVIASRRWVRMARPDGEFVTIRQTEGEVFVTDEPLPQVLLVGKDFLLPVSGEIGIIILEDLHGTSMAVAMNDLRERVDAGIFSEIQDKIGFHWAVENSHLIGWATDDLEFGMALFDLNEADISPLADLVIEKVRARGVEFPTPNHVSEGQCS